MRNFFQHIGLKYNKDTSTQLKKYSNLNGKLAKQTEKLKFLLQSKQYGIIPKHIINCSNTNKMFNNIKTTQQAEKIEHSFHLRILKLEIKEANIDIQETKKEMEHAERTIKSTLNQKETTDFFNKQKNTHNYIKTKTRERQIQKLDTLKMKKIEEFGFIINEEWFVNKTKIEFPEESKWLLSLGRKFAIPVNKQNFSPIKLITDIEQAIQTLQDEKDKEIKRTTLCNRIRSHKNSLHNTTKEKFILNIYKNTQKFIRKHKDEIVITTADKGNKTVVIYKQHYLEKMGELLEDKTVYGKIREDPTEKLQRKNNQIVNELFKQKHINFQLKAKMYCSAAQPPLLYGLPKIHKENCPLRPISASPNVPCYHLSKYIGSILKTLISPDYNIKNIFELKEKLSNQEIKEEEILISYDVISLFTNISTTLAIRIILKKWDLIKTQTTMSRSQFQKILEFCLIENNYFKYNSDLYRQSYGMPMGNPLSPTIADIVLDDLLNYTKKRLEEEGITIRMIYKYVDDMVAIVKKEDNLKIIKILDEYHPKLKFTFEPETDKSIAFLDSKIHRREQKLILNWYAKEIASGRILNFNSAHIKSQKINTANNLVRKIMQISHPEFKQENIQKIHNLLHKNNYPHQIIRDLISKNENIIINNQKNNVNTTNTTTSQNAEPKIFIGVQYIPNLTETKHLRSLINQEHIKIAHRPTQTINKLFTKTKDRTPLLDNNNVVYEIRCQNCNNKYIGQTKRALKTRIDEHKKDRDKEKETTALSQHLKVHKHSADFEHVKILDHERNKNKRLTLESLRIQQQIDKCINHMEDKDKISLVYTVIL